jgi:hypothetical protein
MQGRTGESDIPSPLPRSTSTPDLVLSQVEADLANVAVNMSDPDMGGEKDVSFFRWSKLRSLAEVRPSGWNSIPSRP